MEMDIEMDVEMDIEMWCGVVRDGGWGVDGSKSESDGTGDCVGFWCEIGVGGV